MKRRFQEGSSTSEGLWILAILAIILFFFVLPSAGSPLGAPREPGQVTESTITARGSNNSRTYGPALSTNPNSSYASYISLGKGNASYSQQSYEEYITISNKGKAPIDITSWRLANAKSERPYDYGGMLRYFPSDSAVIPQASSYINPAGASPMQNVVLERGETAIITTGSVGATTPYRITSFKENICSGYLEEMPEYEFNPPLSRSCPRPSEEPGYSSLPPACRDFIRSNVSTCEIPKFDREDRDGNPCSTCINGERTSSTCADFIKSHYSYQGCVAYHAGDPEFSGRTWRIFLNRGWEMWAEDYETISLFDRLGNLVDSLTY